MKFSFIQGLRQVFRAVHIFASSLATQGTYLTTATIGGEGTIFVESTVNFSSAGGSGQIIDNVNDRDAFTYTGKTATTLTGCSGVLAHSSGATIIPLVQDIVIDSRVNEIRFFGDRGDGTVEELFCAGIRNISGTFYLQTVGSAATSRRAINANSNADFTAVINNNNGSGTALTVSAGGSPSNAQTAIGVFVLADGVSSGSGITAGLVARSTNGYSIIAQGKGIAGASHIAPFQITPSGSSSAPSHIAARGSFWVDDNGNCYINQDGTATGWKQLSTGGALLNIQILTTGTSYTPTSGTTEIIIELLAGGGGGGGAGGAGSASGGGSGGGYARKRFTGIGAGPYTYAIGAAGTAGTAGGGNGGNGGDTTFAGPGPVTVTAKGGLGGTGDGGIVGTASVGGNSPVISTNGDINGSGMPGEDADLLASIIFGGGGGFNPLFGRGGKRTRAQGAGEAGTGNGSGGAGANNVINTPVAGGAGTKGIIVVYEYS